MLLRVLLRSSRLSHKMKKKPAFCVLLNSKSTGRACSIRVFLFAYRYQSRQNKEFNWTHINIYAVLAPCGVSTARGGVTRLNWTRPRNHDQRATLSCIDSSFEFSLLKQIFWLMIALLLNRALPTRSSTCIASRATFIFGIPQHTPHTSSNLIRTPSLEFAATTATILLYTRFCRINWHQLACWNQATPLWCVAGHCVILFI